ncbi:MAG TPA: N-acetylglucosamine-6-phosphate deacetylase [Vicinamibacterales bacterium]|nr:N-acetylglucosamine-6-phosphate deacetylase [Vicinamibacterales bacterium]
MLVLSGADLVLPDRVLSPGTIVIDGDRIADVRADTVVAQHAQAFAFRHHTIVAGFIDVHVHGVEGIDALDADEDGSPVAAIAERLPRYGVTAFCPTTVACAPAALRSVLAGVRAAREAPPPRSARVLPAHLESNFINPVYAGAQPAACLRVPARTRRLGAPAAPREPEAAFDGDEILDEIERAAPDVGIVTVAPELDGGLDLVRWLRAQGIRVSLGHSAADFDQAIAAIAAGASHATHLFNRMPPFGHREPGLAGAVLQTDEVAAELICDGVHVHPAVVRAAIAAKKPQRVFAITDGTAAAGLPAGAAARLGGRRITARDGAARLDDGTLAGSVLTMDAAFRMLIGRVGLSLVDAATLCATTPARELGLVGHGVIAPEARADLVVLDPQLMVVQTYVAGQLVYSRT